MDNTVVNESDSSSDKGGKEEKRQLYIPLRKETTNISNMYSLTHSLTYSPTYSPTYSLAFLGMTSAATCSF